MSQSKRVLQVGPQVLLLLSAVTSERLFALHTT